MISVICEKEEKTRRVVSRALIRSSIDCADCLMGEDHYDFTRLLRRDRARIMFSECPKTEKEIEAARLNALTILANEGNEFTEEEKAFARVFLYHFNRGDGIRRFFLNDQKARSAKNMVFNVARNGFVFNRKEDEELV